MLFSLQEDFWRSYVLQNITFSGFGQSYYTKLVIFLKAIIRARDSWFVFFITFLTLVLCFSLILRSYSLRSINKPRTFNFIFYSLCILIASAYSIIQAGTGFTHHLLFLIHPCGFLIGTVLGESKKLLRLSKSQLFMNDFQLFMASNITIVILVVSISQIGLPLIKGNTFIANRKFYLDNYISPLSEVILKYASKGDSMAIWGWTPELYVETGIFPATRDAVSTWQFYPNPQQSYYVNRFIKDLNTSKPKLFIDTLTPNRFGFSWNGYQSQSFKNLPEVKRIIDDEYTLVSEFDQVGIYKLIGTP
jgi:hypothetical protein